MQIMRLKFIPLHPVVINDFQSHICQKRTLLLSLLHSSFENLDASAMCGNINALRPIASISFAIIKCVHALIINTHFIVVRILNAMQRTAWLCLWSGCIRQGCTQISRVVVFFNRSMRLWETWQTENTYVSIARWIQISPKSWIFSGIPNRWIPAQSS